MATFKSKAEEMSYLTGKSLSQCQRIIELQKISDEIDKAETLQELKAAMKKVVNFIPFAT